jgi:peptide deformylase
VPVPLREPLDELIRDMFDTMEAEKGIGLAAPQIGVSQRIMVLRVPRRGEPPTELVLLNPVFRETSGSEVAEEGCLSIPGVTDDVKRAWRVVVTGVTEKGEPVDLEADDLLARALQHEMDHLDGIFFVDRLSLVRRRLLRRPLEEIARRSDVTAAA